MIHFFWRHRDPAIPVRSIRGALLLIIGAFLLNFLTFAASFAQLEPGSASITTGYGVVDDDFSIFAGIAGYLSHEMSVEATLGLVPSRGEYSDLYSAVAFRYHLWPDGPIVPHLGAGLGAVTLIGLGNREVDFSYSVGGGCLAFASERLAFRADGGIYAVSLEEKTDVRRYVWGGMTLIF